MFYVCPTPIGNLEDITIRVLRVLQEVDLILAEDTRRSGLLLQHFQIEKPLSSLHEHNEREKSGGIIKALAGGKKIALLADAGMPAIADPGAFLIGRVIEAGLPLEVLPGANAALVAYLLSGLFAAHFLFYGFLPRRSSARRRALQSLKDYPFPLIFYEAPHRLLAMLGDLLRVLGDRPASISRELTKLYEQTRRGTVRELRDYFAENAPRGEFVVVVSGKKAEDLKKQEDDIYLAVQKLMARGETRRSAVELVSREYRLPKNQVYAIALQVKTKD